MRVSCRQVARRVLFATALFYVVGEYARGGDIDTFRAIIAAMKGRCEQYNPSRVRYRVESTRTKYAAAGTLGIDPEDKRAFDKLPSTKVSSLAEYARKGVMTYNSWERVTNEDAKPGTKESNWFKFDGKLRASGTLGSNVIAVGRDVAGWPMADLFTELTAEHVLFDIAEEYNDIELARRYEVTLTKDVGTVKGAERKLTLRRTAEYDATFVYWLGAATPGYCVMRRENYGSAKKINHEAYDIVYAASDGVSYVKSAKYRNYFATQKFHEVAEQRSFNVESVTFRANEIPDALFDTKVPAGATIIDRDRNNAVITDPVEAQKAIDKAIEGSVPPAADRRGVLVVASVMGFAGVVVAAVVVGRLRRRVNASKPRP